MTWDMLDRFVLAPLPPDAPQAVRVVGSILYLAAPAAVLVPAFIFEVMLRSRLPPMDSRWRTIAWTSLVITVLLAVRFWLAAFARASYLLNASAVVATYLALLVLSSAFHGIAGKDRRSFRSASGPLQRWLLCASDCGLYVQLIGTMAFLMSPVNVWVRLIEGGFVVVMLASFSLLDGGFPRNRAGALARILVRRSARVTVAFVTIGSVLLILRDLERAPEWIDAALLLPAYLVVLSGPVTVSLGHELPRRFSLPTSGVETNSVNDTTSFHARVADELHLTTREREVIRLLMDGYSTSRIAFQLSVSEKTVRNHISSLYRKTETSNRIELVHVFEPAAHG